MVKSVHDSEFSEFGFGYTVTNGLTHFRSGTLSPWLKTFRRAMRFYHLSSCEDVKLILEGKFRLTTAQAQAVVDAYGAPFIPTQHLENSFPVDVALNSNGIFYFLQFKRSHCVSKKGDITEKIEKKIDQFKLPFYRVYFYNNSTKLGKGDKRQRENLEKLETSLSDIKSALVRYAVPAFHTLEELSKVYQNGLAAKIDGRSPVMCFKASAFSLPGTSNHHISYDAAGTGWRFSEKAEKVLDVHPLISEINEAAPLRKTMGQLCEILDQHASDMRLPKRPKKMSHEALLHMFGLRAKKPDDEKPTGDETSSLEFLRAPIADQYRTKELAKGIRKILKYSDEEHCQMKFLEDFYGADYRCQQIIGQPLIVGVRNG